MRGMDRGAQASPENTGYERVYVSPGVEINIAQAMHVYADFRLPVLTHVRGYQLVAPSLVNISVEYTP